MELRGTLDQQYSPHNVKIIFEIQANGYFYHKISVSCQDMFCKNIENNVKIKPNKFNT